MSNLAAARRTQDTSDKAIAVEQRLNGLVNAVGPVSAGGGNGQRVTGFVATAVSINSTSLIAITGLSWPVVAGAYLLQGILTYVGDQSGGAPAFRLEGPAASHVRVTLWDPQGFGSGISSINLNQWTAMDSDFDGPTLSTATEVLFIDGMVVFTAGGTLTIQARDTVNGDTFSVSSYSYITLESVGQTS